MAENRSRSLPTRVTFMLTVAAPCSCNASEHAHRGSNRAVCPIRAVVGREHAAVQHAVGYKLQRLVKFPVDAFRTLPQSSHLPQRVICVVFRHGAKCADLLGSSTTAQQPSGTGSSVLPPERNPFLRSSTMLSAALLTDARHGRKRRNQAGFRYEKARCVPICTHPSAPGGKSRR